MYLKNPYWEINFAPTFKAKIKTHDFFLKQELALTDTINGEIIDFLKNEKEELVGVQKLSKEFKCIYLLYKLYKDLLDGGVLYYVYSGSNKLDAQINCFQYMKHAAGIIELNELKKRIASINFNKATDFKQFEKEYQVEAEKFSDILVNLHFIFHTKEEFIFNDVVSRIKSNPSLFLLDVNGNEINSAHSEKVNIEKGNNREEYTIVNGKIEGRYKFFIKNILKKEKIYEAGISIKAITYKNDGFYEEMLFDAEKRIYRYRAFYSTGQLKSERFVDKKSVAKEVGCKKSYYENGQLKKEINHNSDTKEKEFTSYYSNGQIKSIGPRNNRIYNFWNEDGKQTVIDGNGYFLNKTDTQKGERQQIGAIENTYFEGEIATYYDGKIANIRNYKAGKQSGNAIQYYDNGQIKEKAIFANNRFVTGSFYRKNGTVERKVTTDDIRIDYKLTITYNEEEKVIKKILKRNSGGYNDIPLNKITTEEIRFWNTGILQSHIACNKNATEIFYRNFDSNGVLNSEKINQNLFTGTSLFDE